MKLPPEQRSGLDIEMISEIVGIAQNDVKNILYLHLD